MEDKNKNLRRQFFANQMHKNLFFLFSVAAIFPALITAMFMFYLVFYITAQQFGIPEVIVYNLIPAARRVLFILAIVAPATIIIVLYFAHRITHKIVGPFDRIVRELDENIRGKRQGHIVLRKNDRFWPLVEKINILLDKLSR